MVEGAHILFIEMRCQIEHGCKSWWMSSQLTLCNLTTTDTCISNAFLFTCALFWLCLGMAMQNPSTSSGLRADECVRHVHFTEHGVVQTHSLHASIVSSVRVCTISQLARLSELTTPVPLRLIIITPHGSCIADVHSFLPCYPFRGSLCHRPSQHKKTKRAWKWYRIPTTSPAVPFKRFPPR